MGSGMLYRNEKSFLPPRRQKWQYFPPPFVTLYLHSNNLWQELLSGVWPITREPSFQEAKGRVHRSVKGVHALRVVGQGPRWASSRSQVIAVADLLVCQRMWATFSTQRRALLVHDCTWAVQSKVHCQVEDTLVFPF